MISANVTARTTLVRLLIVLLVIGAVVFLGLFLEASLLVVLATCYFLVIRMIRSTYPQKAKNLINTLF